MWWTYDKLAQGPKKPACSQSFVLPDRKYKACQRDRICRASRDGLEVSVAASSHVCGSATVLMLWCASCLAASSCQATICSARPTYCNCCRRLHRWLGGNYSGAFVNEFKIFVAELRDFFNAAGLTQLLENVRGGMGPEDQQVGLGGGAGGVCVTRCGWVGWDPARWEHPAHIRCSQHGRLHHCCLC